MSELAVQGCTLDISIEETLGTISCTHKESGSTDNVKVDGKEAYFGQLTTKLSGITLVLTAYPAASFDLEYSSTLTINISGTAGNVLDDKQKAVQKNDEGTASLAYIATNTQTGATISGAVVVTAKITDAGQTSVIVS